MADPIVFTSASPRYALPLLFPGQTQKEFFVNQAHALTDALLHPAIEGEADDPPAEPGDGECWLVGLSPTGEWAGHAGDLASYQAGVWLFCTPRDGLRVLDRATGQDIRYHGSWMRTEAVPVPSGGTTIDSEARDAIQGLIGALTAAGILPGA